MFNSLSLFLGIRYIKSRQKNGFASFISASSTIGIALGVTVLIVVLSAMNGFERALAKHLLSVVPHTELIGVNEPMKNWQKEAQVIGQHPDVLAIAPIIKIQGMMQKKDQLKGVELRGVNIELEQQVSAIKQYVTEGKWQDLSNENAVIIGSGIAKKLNLTVGDQVQILLPNNNPQQDLAQQFASPIKRYLNVVAIFNFGGVIDQSQSYISLKLAQDLMNYNDGQVQGLRLTVNDVFNAPRIARQAAVKTDHYLYIYDWTHVHGSLFNDIQLVRMVMYIVLVLVIAVASFNIVSTLIMVVNEKKGDIAILKTMGASHYTIMLTFVLQGVMNGVVGCVVGGMLGCYLALNLTNIISFIETSFQTKFLSSDIYFIDFLPSHLESQDVISTLVIALLLSLVATIYPAWRATKIEPAQVLGQM
ncbi:lipoprotein-releasing ABC transporter permease subunit LolE [Thalassotalea profundi]|uniref:Transporter n=1 Tax=Thalassotalea profundi TaxID=2036687 RepID=A0ABQ3IG64_9GAMM|nr:lipoprotein-releasing ABC transporter permease subunit LolE [Thalassotalea profundi]GHE76877.1 transporter [Thalassotalea profundi]